jgi:hypothetical protein
VTQPEAVAHSTTATFHWLAAAWISNARASAPPLRTYSCDSRTPRLPPVLMLPQARLRARFWPGVGYSVFTRAQSHPSSSATSWARPVSVPCPISERAMRMTTLSSGSTCTQAFSSGVAAASCARPGTWKPTIRPPAAALVVCRNERRESTALMPGLPR